MAFEATGAPIFVAGLKITLSASPFRSRRGRWSCANAALMQTADTRWLVPKKWTGSMLPEIVNNIILYVPFGQNISGNVV